MKNTNDLRQELTHKRTYEKLASLTGLTESDIKMLSMGHALEIEMGDHVLEISVSSDYPEIISSLEDDFIGKMVKDQGLESAVLIDKWQRFMPEYAPKLYGQQIDYMIKPTHAHAPIFMREYRNKTWQWQNFEETLKHYHQNGYSKGDAWLKTIEAAHNAYKSYYEAHEGAYTEICGEITISLNGNIISQSETIFGYDIYDHLELASYIIEFFEDGEIRDYFITHQIETILPSNNNMLEYVITEESYDCRLGSQCFEKGEKWVLLALFNDYAGSTIEKANIGYLEENFGHDHPDIAIFNTAYDGQECYVMVYSADRNLVQAINGLCDYPIIDDQAFNKVEIEIEDQSFDQYGYCDFAKALGEYLGIDLNNTSVEALTEVYHDLCYHSSGDHFTIEHFSGIFSFDSLLRDKAVIERLNDVAMYVKLGQ